MIDSGFLLINKPAGRSSHSSVAQVRRCVGKQYKVGHGGTLDPFATGLLIVGVGRAATKHLGALLTCDKKYVARGQLGLLTDTLDGTGIPMATHESGPITRAAIEQAAASLGNSYLQKPPLVSAKKYEGARLYQLVRKGKKTPEELDAIAARKSRVVTLHTVKIVDFEVPSFTIQAHVSHGTYIRSLVLDIAQAAGSCATTMALERSAIGPLRLENAIDLDSIQQAQDVTERLIPIDQFLQLLAQHNHPITPC